MALTEMWARVTSLTKWQSFWTWLTKYWGIVLSVFGAIGGVVVTLMFKRGQAACVRAETQAEIAANLRDVARSEGRRQAVVERIRNVDEQIAKVDTELEDQTVSLRAKREEVEGMTTQERIDRFRDLGY